MISYEFVYETTILSSRNVCALVLIPVVLGCIAFSPQARAVTPPLDGNYPNQNTAEGDDALLSVTTGAGDTVMGFDSLYRNTTGSDKALASWIWRGTRRLNKGHYLHTATLLQNGMVLVAGGVGITQYILASAELGHGHR